MHRVWSEARRRLRETLDAVTFDVLAAEDLQTARELAPRLKRVVPGIRLAGAPRHDQVRAASPQEADFAILRLDAPWYPVDTRNPFALGFHHGDRRVRLAT